MIRIHFERSGGFAGMGMAATIDSDSLSPQEERDLRSMVEAAGFFQLPGMIAAPTTGADRFVYRLAVEVDGQEHTVEMSEAAVPSQLRPLLEWLTTAARKARRRGLTP